MMKVFGYSYGTARVAVRYTDAGEVRFFARPGKYPGGPSAEMLGDVLHAALRDAEPLDSGAELSSDQIRALQRVVEILIADTQQRR